MNEKIFCAQREFIFVEMFEYRFNFIEMGIILHILQNK